MASLPDETLRKVNIYEHLTSTLAQFEKIAQINTKDRERKILQLTIKEISSMDEDVPLYRGVGKMFMMEPHKAMIGDLKGQEKELTDDINNLNKKAKFLEKQYKDAQAQMRDIFHHAPKQQ
ncbi:hypothetical protein NP233_g8857 [Leucocoprinus birnbaumii]|uniref:Prefoldin subunit 1 n=1 Tax=Leucocoprinus birnbaumii TaxID=56174 RepID=A0AAD5VLS8_9AGAR|nr:hypothetical protein NP233_g8857 [Leucocoprinus birnbaumii]